MIKSLREARIVDGVPRIVAGQEWVQALSEALGALHEKTLDYADASQIYTALDTAPEEILDVLAVNWKTDWYDTSSSLEEKRRIIKTVLTSRRLMGTAYAVQLQANAIYPGSKVEEWFDYGGTPGCFRFDVELLPEGVSGEQYRRLLKGILLTKNVRSHLESVNFWTESRGVIRLGAYTAASTRLEIWPELVSKLEVVGQAGASSITAARQTVEIYPELASKMEVMGQAGASSITAARQTVEIYPELASKIEVMGQTGAGSITAARQTVEIYPETIKED